MKTTKFAANISINSQLKNSLYEKIIYPNYPGLIGPQQLF